MQKRIILILTDGMPAGGTERQIVELLKGLRKKNDISTIIGILMKDGVFEKEAYQYADKIMPVSQKRRFDFTLSFSLARYARKHSVDLIHTFGIVSDFSGIFAGHLLKRPIINGSIRSARKRLNLYDRFNKFCMKYSTWIVANSYAGIKSFGLDNLKNTSVIYNGLDAGRFDQKDFPPANPHAICMVGNFTKKKDQVALIKALPLIKKKFTQAKLFLVGNGNNLAFCQELSQSLNLENSIKLYSHISEPAPIINESSVCVLLSPNGEGISNAILEYMALSKPVVATDLGGNREVIKNNDTGILIKDHHPETVANAILSLLGDPIEAKRIGKAGRVLVEKHFNTERMVNDYKNLYHSILNGYY